MFKRSLRYLEVELKASMTSARFSRLRESMKYISSRSSIKINRLREGRNLYPSGIPTIHLYIGFTSDEYYLGQDKASHTFLHDQRVYRL